jgi:hypothetical protein
MKLVISKIRKLATEHPTLVTIGLGLAITFAIGAVIGMLDPQPAYAHIDGVHIQPVQAYCTYC